MSLKRIGTPGSLKIYRRIISSLESAALTLSMSVGSLSHLPLDFRISIMKVAELIELLNTCDPEMRVVVAGYEGGVSDVGEVKPIPILLNVNKDWYYGKHEPCESYEQDELALIISASDYDESDEEIE